MNELKDQLSNYIQFVFDNEKSFIETFTKKSDYVIDIDFFYMGSGHHLVRFNCDLAWTQPNQRMKRIIKWDEFEDWINNLTSITKQG